MQLGDGIEPHAAPSTFDLITSPGFGLPHLRRWPPKPHLISQSSHGESGVARRNRRRLPPLRGRRGGAGGEAGAHPGRPSRRGG